MCKVYFDQYNKQLPVAMWLCMCVKMCDGLILFEGDGCERKEEKEGRRLIGWCGGEGVGEFLVHIRYECLWYRGLVPCVCWIIELSHTWIDATCWMHRYDHHIQNSNERWPSKSEVQQRKQWQCADNLTQ